MAIASAMAADTSGMWNSHYEEVRHNAPISMVIKRYMDKGGGKVIASRQEIKRRFYGLDWRYQKQILFAFLQSGKTDREWAYGRLYSVWDDCFIPVLQELWERYHEKHLSWLVIRFCPVAYLKKEFVSLSEGRNYFFLYQRLAGEEDFVLDLTRLNEADLLSVWLHNGKVIPQAGVWDLFFLILYKLSKGVYQFRAWKALDSDLSIPSLTIFDTPIMQALFNVVRGELDDYDLMESLSEWIHKVSKSFIKDYGNVDEIYHPTDEEYKRGFIKEHCLKNIDSEYRSVLDSIDVTDQQAVLDILDQRHKKHAHEEIVKRTMASNQKQSCPEEPYPCMFLNIFKT